MKNGKSNEGKQRYRCRNAECSRRSFIRDYSDRRYLAEVKQQISDMAVNGSGVRDTARVLKISPTTPIEELKKDRVLEQVNTQLLQRIDSPFEPVMVVRVEETEIDEMWSVVQSKKQQRWLWYAIDHQTGAVLAYVLASHTDAALEQMQQLLAPFSIGQVYAESWGADLRLIDPQQHTVGKANTQRIERKHLTLHT